MSRTSETIAELVVGLTEVAGSGTAEAIAKVLGVEVYDVAPTDPRAGLVDVLGLAWYEASPWPCICVSSGLRGALREEALAHELGHSVIDVCMMDVAADKAEVWCDAFASALLAASLLAGRDSGRATAAHVARVENPEIEKLSALL